MVSRCARLPQLIVRLLVGGALLLGTSACASVPNEQQVKQFLGLERSFAHNDIPAPPTPSAYILQLGMSQTQRLVVREAQNAKQYEITDPRTIQEVLHVLRTGSTSLTTNDGLTPASALQLDFIAGSPERIVTAHYNPASGMLQLYNIPTPAWPDHAVATYAVTPTFGAALLHVLRSQPT